MGLGIAHRLVIGAKSIKKQSLGTRLSSYIQGALDTVRFCLYISVFDFDYEWDDKESLMASCGCLLEEFYSVSTSHLQLTHNKNREAIPPTKHMDLHL